MAATDRSDAAKSWEHSTGCAIFDEKSTEPCNCKSDVASGREVKTSLDTNWTLVERYVEHYPDDWRLVFRRGDEVLEVSVPEEVWRAFDA